MTIAAIHGEGLDKTPALNLSGRIPELDGLRGLAILLVILCHYVGGVDHGPAGFWARRFFATIAIGWSGVDLFFVLSGFLIGGILLDARNSPHYFRAFYMRRVFRILPIYYVWTLLFAVTVLISLAYFPSRLGVTSADLQRVPIQLLFLQNVFIGMPPFQWTWFVVTWSLAIEEQFYLLAPPLIRFFSLRKFVTFLGATVVLAPLLRILIFRYWSPGTYLCAYLMPCRADALSCGMLLAVAWRDSRFREFVHLRGAILRRLLVVLLLGLGGLLWWLAHPMNAVTLVIGLSWLAFFYSALLLTVVSQPAGWLAGVMRWKWLRWLGGVSYCVYLLHDTFKFFAHRIFLHAEPQIYSAKGVGVSLFALALTLAVATLSWRYFEKPLVRRGHGYSYGEAAA
jgi:peptidoglycan/LPS O-acetylase OafA/YrhL